MANEQNLRPGEYKLTLEEQKKGGIASGEARREKSMMKKTLEQMLNSSNGDKGLYKDNVTLGLIANAIDKTKGGNPEAYKTIVSILGELEDKQNNDTPDISINIIDNTKLEKVMYDNKD